MPYLSPALPIPGSPRSAKSPCTIFLLIHSQIQLSLNMMNSVVIAVGLAAVVSAQGVTSLITPTATAPGGCATSTASSFEIQAVNVTTSSSKKRGLSKVVRTIPCSELLLTSTARLRLGIPRNYLGRWCSEGPAGSHRVHCREQTVSIRWSSPDWSYLHRRYASPFKLLGSNQDLLLSDGEVEGSHTLALVPVCLDSNSTQLEGTC